MKGSRNFRSSSRHTRPSHSNTKCTENGNYRGSDKFSVSCGTDEVESIQNHNHVLTEPHAFSSVAVGSGWARGGQTADTSHYHHQDAHIYSMMGYPLQVNQNQLYNYLPHPQNLMFQPAPSICHMLNNYSHQYSGSYHDYLMYAPHYDEQHFHLPQPHNHQHQYHVIGPNYVGQSTEDSSALTCSTMPSYGSSNSHTSTNVYLDGQRICDGNQRKKRRRRGKRRRRRRKQPAVIEENQSFDAHHGSPQSNGIITNNDIPRDVSQNNSLTEKMISLSIDGHDYTDDHCSNTRSTHSTASSQDQSSLFSL